MRERLHEAVPPPAQVERHQEMEILIAVTGEDEGRQAGLGDLDPQLFLQFADQAGLRRLPRLDLPSRKLPQAPKRLARRAAADEHPSVDVDQGAGGDEQ